MQTLSSWQSQLNVRTLLCLKYFLKSSQPFSTYSGNNFNSNYTPTIKVRKLVTFIGSNSFIQILTFLEISCPTTIYVVQL